MLTILNILFGLLGGLLNRIRGGLWNIGSTTIARLLYVLPIGIIVFIITKSILLGIGALLSFYLGLLPSWGVFMTMGRDNNPNDENDNPPISWVIGKYNPLWPFWKRWTYCCMGMALRGLLLFAPFGLFLWCFKIISLKFILWGGLMPIFYEFDQQLMDRGYTEANTRWRKYIGAELLFGIFTYCLIFTYLV